MSEVKNALFPLRCNELKQNGNTQVQEPWSCTCRRVLEWMYFPLCANKSCCSQSIKTTLHQTQKIRCWELDNAFDCDSLKKSTKLNMQTKWIIYKIIYLGFPRRRAGRLIWCFTVQYSRIKDKLSVRMSEKTSHFDFFSKHQHLCSAVSSSSCQLFKSFPAHTRWLLSLLSVQLPCLILVTS